MELSKMEHELNEAWATLGTDHYFQQVLKIMDANPPSMDELVLSNPKEACLVKMVLSYIGMKHLFESQAKAELEEHNR